MRVISVSAWACIIFLMGGDSDSLGVLTSYEVFIFSEVGENISEGTINLEFLPPDESICRKGVCIENKIEGRWRWSRGLLFADTTGELAGSVRSNGHIFLSFDVCERVTDCGYSFRGKFSQDHRGDFEGEVFTTTIAGASPNGQRFKAFRN